MTIGAKLKGINDLEYAPRFMDTAVIRNDEEILCYVGYELDYDDVIVAEYAIGYNGIAIGLTDEERKVFAEEGLNRIIENGKD